MFLDFIRPRTVGVSVYWFYCNPLLLIDRVAGIYRARLEDQVEVVKGRITAAQNLKNVVKGYVDEDVHWSFREFNTDEDGVQHIVSTIKKEVSCFVG